jgi:ribosomal protein L16 Arg81 hydroxylase
VYVPGIDELLGDEEAFFAKHFDRAPLLRRNALAGDPRQVLSVADLDQLLFSEAIRPPYLRITKDGRQVVQSSYTAPVAVQGEYVTDCVDPERVVAHVRTGATLTWSSLNHHRPNLRALASALARTFAARTDVIAFLTPAGRQGLAPHYDPVDVFVVQLEGTKSWRVWSPPALRRGDDAGNLPVDQLGEPALEAELEPGDVLYMPYGAAHVAAATTTMSLHLSVTVEPRRWADLLASVVGRIVAEDPAFWRFPYLAGGSDPTLADELRALCATLAERLTGLDAGAELRRLAAGGGPGAGIRQDSPLQRMAAADGIAPGTRLRLGTARTEVVGRSGGTARVSVDGSVYTMPEPVVAALDGWPPGVERPAGTLLPGAGADDCVHVARTLVRLGVLEVAVP